MENRQKRKLYLMKKEDRRRRLPDFLSSMSVITGQTITTNDVLSIETSNEVWDKIDYNQKFQQAILHISFPYTDKYKLTKILETLKYSLYGQKLYFTTYHFVKTCLILTDTSFCFDNYEELVEFDENSIYVYDERINNMLWIDRSEIHWKNKEEYTWTFELRVCGVDWISKVFKVYQELES